MYLAEAPQTRVRYVHHVRLVAWFDGGPKHGQTMWLRAPIDPLLIFTGVEHADRSPRDRYVPPLARYRLVRLVGNVAFYEHTRA